MRYQYELDTSTESERKRVRRGAMVLDRVVPGWHMRVNLETLVMSSGQLCMLGQLFGRDAETSIAKEMYPELWKRKSLNGAHSGYYTGCTMIPQLTGLNAEDIDYCQYDSDEYNLGRACRGVDNRCLWAEEVATRRAQDAVQTEQKGDTNAESHA